MTGNLFILSAPSGAGKSTLSAKLLEEDRNVHLSEQQQGTDHRITLRCLIADAALDARRTDGRKIR